MCCAQTDQLRAYARSIFERAVDAADPARALRRTLVDHPFPVPDQGGRTILIAIGKAAPAMLKQALANVHGEYSALAVTHYENDMVVPGATVMHAAHPVPDEKGLRAGKAVTGLLQSATSKDRVIALISGGGSALLPAPVHGVDLLDKAETNRVLLSAGLNILQMNLIRQQLSDLKGGGFLRHAAPSSVTGYILSDVIGDDLRVVASGPTVAPIGSNADACRVGHEAGIWMQLPQSVRNVLEHGRTGNILQPANNILIGSNRVSLKAAQDYAAQHFDSRIVSDQLVGDVCEAAKTIADAAGLVSQRHPVALLFGGETTVKLAGNGKGGRNQELALRVAQLLSKRLRSRDWVFLSGGTDGRDGPTDAAGGITCSGSLSRMDDHLDIDRALANNDSYRVLSELNDLLVTGATGTNVADIQCLLIGDKRG